MYVCMYICMYVCVYAYMYVYRYACLFVCMYVCMYVVCMYIHMYICMYDNPCNLKRDLLCSILVSHFARIRSSAILRIYTPLCARAYVCSRLFECEYVCV